MEPQPSARLLPRGWLLGAGLLLGIAAAFVAPGTAGCVYHDTCIKVTSVGHDWCRNLANAKQWPVGGSYDDAEPILRLDGGSPRGCRCVNDAEDEILELEIGNCEYGSPPVGGSCPEPNPYECATGGGGDVCDSEGDIGTSGDETGADETATEESGEMVLDVDAFVTCLAHDCEIDETFARQLYVDPSPLLAQRARLVYDPLARRHVLHAVERDSLAHALGLRTGDRLESVDSLTIHDLDSALQVYVQLGQRSMIEVRVQRGSQWLDFTYTLVP